MAKQGGLRAIRQTQSSNGSPNYSVSNIEPGDMNYLEPELSISLYKDCNESPESLSTLEALLCGIEALLIC